jgi:cell division septal protein FtsQ
VGDNIFAVDLAEVAVQVEHLPWVEKVLIERKPPDRLVISVVERQRLAWVELGEIYGVDKEGVLLPAASEENESYRDLDLPVISGLQTMGDSLKTGEVLGDSTLTQPLGDEGLRLRLVGDGLEVRLPLDRVSERLRVLKKLMARVYRECPDPAYIDLRFAGQVVVGTATAKPSS